MMEVFPLVEMFSSRIEVAMPTHMMGAAIGCRCRPVVSASGALRGLIPGEAILSEAPGLPVRHKVF